LSSSSGGKNQGALNSDKGATVTAAAGGAAPPPGDGEDPKFSSTKSKTKWENQLKNRGWTAESVKDTIENPYTTKGSVNRATGNDATAYFNKDGSYVIRDSNTREVIQLSDRTNIAGWKPDSQIINPYIPKP
jgi:Colicin E5 ribonuclease domain